MIDSILLLLFGINVTLRILRSGSEENSQAPAGPQTVPQKWSRKLLFILFIVFFDMYLNVSLGNILIAPSKLSEFDHDFIDIVHGDFL